MTRRDSKLVANAVGLSVALVVLAGSLCGCEPDVWFTLAARLDGGQLYDAGDEAERPSAPEPALSWASGFEDPRFADWTTNLELHRGRFYTSAGADLETTAKHVHSGQFAAKITLNTGGGSLRIAKFLREGPLLEHVTFSAWFFLPSNYRIDDYLNLIQLRGRTNGNGTGDDLSLWDLNLRSRNGKMELSLYDHLRQKIWPNLPNSSTEIPVNAWFQLKVEIQQATASTGQVRVWQDSALSVDLQGLPTVPSTWLQCNVGALTPGANPSPLELFVDDVALDFHE